MKIDTTLECGHAFRLELPDSTFDRGELIAPCPTCGTRYIIRKNGVSGRFILKQFRFLAMHY